MQCCISKNKQAVLFNPPKNDAGLPHVKTGKTKNKEGV